MDIPNDPAILLSFINMKLRDYYQSLDDLCSDMELDRAQIESRIGQIGYIYKDERNQFV